MTDRLREAERFEARRWSAQIGEDVAALQELLSEDLVYTHSSGDRDTKASFIEKIADGVMRFNGATRTESIVKASGGTVLISSKAVISLEHDGREVDVAVRYSAVWVEEAAQLRLLCWHSTPLRA